MNFLPGLATHCRVAVIPARKVDYGKIKEFSSSLNVQGSIYFNCIRLQSPSSRNLSAFVGHLRHLQFYDSVVDSSLCAPR